jgi:hypothetical protein
MTIGQKKKKKPFKCNVEDGNEARHSLLNVLWTQVVTESHKKASGFCSFFFILCFSSCFSCCQPKMLATKYPRPTATFLTTGLQEMEDFKTLSL